MAAFIERRKPYWHAALVVAVMFGTGVVVALISDGVPTWQNHGPKAGPGMVWQIVDPGMYFWLTTFYAIIAAVASFFTFFRFPWATFTHIRLLFLVPFLLLLMLVIYSLMMPKHQDKARAAWRRIETLGGKGVWEPDMVVVSFANTDVTDEDLSLFDDFPHVQILDLSHTKVTDNCLQHLTHVNALTSLILVDTEVRSESIEKFKSARPEVEVKTEPTPRGVVDPFSGKPLGADSP